MIYYMDRKHASQCNGLKGGRPKQDSKIRIELPDVDLVILTPTQYGSLLEKYGYDLLKKAIYLLDKWLKSGSKISNKYVGKNNYGHFRSDGWVINTARIIK
ncbi:MAG: hypothetical protein E7Z89_01540 [Cyanobacteria bacterium SIG28]|nr:hypothetical protein [Cyanobacteria bacterium SIG28]